MEEMAAAAVGWGGGGGGGGGETTTIEGFLRAGWPVWWRSDSQGGDNRGSRVPGDVREPTGGPGYERAESELRCRCVGDEFLQSASIFSCVGKVIGGAGENVRGSDPGVGRSR